MQPVAPTAERQIELFYDFEGKPASIVPQDAWGHIFSYLSHQDQYNALFINKYFLWTNLKSEAGILYWNNRLCTEFPNSVYTARTPVAEYMLNKLIKDNIAEERVSYKTIDLTQTAAGKGIDQGHDRAISMHCGEKRIYLGTQQGKVIFWNLKTEILGEWGCPQRFAGEEARVHCCKEREGVPYVGYCVGEEEETRGVITCISPLNFAIETQFPVPSFQFYKDTLYVQQDKQTIRAYNPETGIALGNFFQTKGNEILAFSIDQKRGLLYLFLADEDADVCTLRNIMAFNLLTQGEPTQIECDMKWPGSECIEFSGNCFYEFSSEKKHSREGVIDIKAKKLLLSDKVMLCNQKPAALGDQVYTSGSTFFGRTCTLHDQTGTFQPFNAPFNLNPFRWTMTPCLGLGKGYCAVQCSDSEDWVLDLRGVGINPRLLITNFEANTGIKSLLFDNGKQFVEDLAFVSVRTCTNIYQWVYPNEF